MSARVLAVVMLLGILLATHEETQREHERQHAIIGKENGGWDVQPGT